MFYLADHADIQHNILYRTQEDVHKFSKSSKLILWVDITIAAVLLWTSRAFAAVLTAASCPQTEGCWRPWPSSSCPCEERPEWRACYRLFSPPAGRTPHSGRVSLHLPRAQWVRWPSPRGTLVSPPREVGAPRIQNPSPNLSCPPRGVSWSSRSLPLWTICEARRCVDDSFHPLFRSHSCCRQRARSQIWGGEFQYRSTPGSGRWAGGNVPPSLPAEL